MEHRGTSLGPRTPRVGIAFGFGDGRKSICKRRRRRWPWRNRVGFERLGRRYSHRPWHARIQEATVPMSALGGRGFLLCQCRSDVLWQLDLPLARIVIGEPANRQKSYQSAACSRATARRYLPTMCTVVESDTVAPLRTTVPKPRQRPLLTQATELRIHRLQLSAGDGTPSAACASTASPRGRASSSRAGRLAPARIFFTRTARAVLATGGRTCPLCRRAVDAIVPLPAIDDSPEKWFAFFDLEGNGRLAPAGGRRARLAVSD